jgi:ABC-type transport system involved in multi-copper enzyme maturation permease subunit
MTVTENTTGPIPEATPSASPTPKRPVLTWHGLKTVAQLELMQRVRSSRWKTTLLLWFIGVGAICVLIATAIQANSYGTRPVGAAIFAANVYFILFMGLLITPTLSSTAINGDRDKGTLAILQASLLTPLEITLGKLAASWFASLAFLFVSVPFIFWAFAAGGVSARAVFSSLIMMAFLLLVVCAVSLYFSARTPKLAGSTVSSYGFVAFTCLISLIIWGLLLATVTSTVTVRQYSGAWMPCPRERATCSAQRSRATGSRAPACTRRPSVPAAALSMRWSARGRRAVPNCCCLLRRMPRRRPGPPARYHRLHEQCTVSSPSHHPDRRLARHGPGHGPATAGSGP